MEYNGLNSCINNLEGAYCIRKFTEFIISLVILIIDLVIIIIMLFVVNADKAQEMAAILAMMATSLIANILYCFYNKTYWLYSLQTYFYNLYYLFIVLYICKSYILKFRKSSNPQKNHKDQLTRSKAQHQKILFYIISSFIILIYTVIFIISIIQEARTSYQDETQPNPKRAYCSEVYYLIFDCLCVLGSIIVVIFLYMNHVQEMDKLIGYQSQGKGKVEESLISQDDLKLKMVQSNNVNNVIVNNRLSNPLKYLWGWILPNVLCQIINLVQSGLLLKANPPQCLIIQSQPELSNYVSLIFLIFTEYMGFVATVVYVLVMKVMRAKAKIDRTVQFSKQWNIEGNIELFYPSRQESIDI